MISPNPSNLVKRIRVPSGVAQITFDGLYLPFYTLILQCEFNITSEYVSIYFNNDFTLTHYTSGYIYENAGVLSSGQISSSNFICPTVYGCTYIDVMQSTIGTAIAYPITALSRQHTLNDKQSYRRVVNPDYGNINRIDLICTGASLFTGDSEIALYKL